MEDNNSIPANSHSGSENEVQEQQELNPPLNHPVANAAEHLADWKLASAPIASFIAKGGYRRVGSNTTYSYFETAGMFTSLI